MFNGSVKLPEGINIQLLRIFGFCFYLLYYRSPAPHLMRNRPILTAVPVQPSVERILAGLPTLFRVQSRCGATSNPSTDGMRMSVSGMIFPFFGSQNDGSQLDLFHLGSLDHHMIWGVENLHFSAVNLLHPEGEPDPWDF